MIIRIVRMHFKEHGKEKFLNIFQANKIAIRNVTGCLHLELLADVDNPLGFTTLSHWENASDLENYRKSALFEKVWTEVKTLFADRSQAFSLEKIVEL